MPASYYGEGWYRIAIFARPAKAKLKLPNMLALHAVAIAYATIGKRYPNIYPIQ